MPLIKIHLLEGAWTAADQAVLLDVVHDVMVESFRVPTTDRYQLLTERPRGHIRALDTGLGYDRSDRFVLMEVVSRPRARDDKVRFYRRLSEVLGEVCGLAPDDLMISMVTNDDEDWSFGRGEAEFVTGKL
ncbi:tautomerase family protein [Rhizobium sp. AN80A]|uniref:tautomerase family protein n=1 Tax=Rhizobium sp. AN80A TaxID=3040673 RepID=UPI0024B3ACC2|nr:tautomerase family protein [Rhizobium sp. AN80A]